MHNPELSSFEAAEYIAPKHGVDGAGVGDSPYKKLDSPDGNKDDSKKTLEKIYTAQPSSTEKSLEALDKKEAMQLAANPDNDSWPPVSFEEGKMKKVESVNETVV